MSLYPDHASRPAAELRVSPPEVLKECLFWTCDDAAERLSHEDLEEAVLEYLEGWSEKSGPEFEAFLHGIAPVTVYGYARAPVTDRDLLKWAEWMVEQFAEAIEEDTELGDPDGNHEIFPPEGQQRLTPLVFEALKQVRSGIEPWACEVVKEVELDGDALVELVRRNQPEWFEAES